MNVSDPQWLKAELAKPGRSQAGLGRAMGLRSSAVNRLVQGGRQLKAKEAAQIEAYLAESEADGAAEPTLMARRAMERLAELGLTPITAATRAGLDRDLFRNMFRTGSYPRADTLASLCRVLGVSADWLLFGDGEISRPEAAPSISSTVTVAAGRVRFRFDSDVSPGVAAQILALLEGDKL